MVVTNSKSKGTTFTEIEINMIEKNQCVIMRKKHFYQLFDRWLYGGLFKQITVILLIGIIDTKKIARVIEKATYYPLYE